MEMPGMCHGQRLQDPADVLARCRFQDKVEMVAHEAVGKQAKRIALLSLFQGQEECVVVGWLGKDADSVIPPIKGVVYQTIGDQSRWSAPVRFSRPWEQAGKGINALTPIFRKL